ncbi:MAG: hypothetical protein QOD29_5821 [Alphaproteobacteria bacterium]|jgi:hypothetical protein|nr:hypothetical protein [Alphaproteobacteria bacterium]
MPVRSSGALFKGAHYPQFRSFPGGIVSLYTNCLPWIPPIEGGGF